MIISIIFFLFRINPKIPIKNKNNDRFIVLEKYFNFILVTGNNCKLIINAGLHCALLIKNKNEERARPSPF